MLWIMRPWIEVESFPVVQQDFEETFSQKANQTGHHPRNETNDLVINACQNIPAGSDAVQMIWVHHCLVQLGP